MIYVEKCPRLGPFGWKATVTVGCHRAEILRVGNRTDIIESAKQLELKLSREQPRLGRRAVSNRFCGTVDGKS